MTPRVFVVSGPSGVGKSSIIKRGLEDIPHMRLSVSTTTREPREGEIDGKDYYFIRREDFEEKRAAGEFLEWAQVYDNYYGTLKSEIQNILDSGNHAVLDVDTQGAMNLKTVCEGAIFIFIKPPSLKDLELRLRERGSETDASLMKRLSNAEREISFASEYDHNVVNDNLDEAYAQFLQIIHMEGEQAIPFSVAQNPNPQPEDGDDSFMEHLRGKIREKIERHFTHQIRAGMTEELVQLIEERMNFILRRDLHKLMRESMASHQHRT